MLSLNDSCPFASDAKGSSAGDWKYQRCNSDSRKLTRDRGKNLLANG